MATGEKVVIAIVGVLLWVSAVLIPIAYCNSQIKWLIDAVISGYLGK